MENGLVSRGWARGFLGGWSKEGAKRARKIRGEKRRGAVGTASRVHCQRPSRGTFAITDSGVRVRASGRLSTGLSQSLPPGFGAAGAVRFCRVGRPTVVPCDMAF